MSFFNGKFITKEITISGTKTTSGNIHIYDQENSNLIAVKAPDVISTSFSLTLPDNNGTNNQVLRTSGSNGILTWVDLSSGGDTLAADDIAEGDSDVNISSTNGNIIINTPNGGNSNIVIGSSEIISVSNIGVDKLVNVASNISWQFRDSDLKIVSPSIDRFEIIADQTINFPISTLMDINGGIFASNTSVISNITISSDFKWRSSSSNLDIINSDTTMRLASLDSKLTSNANSITFNVGSSNSVVFALNNTSSQTHAISRVSGSNYINMSSNVTPETYGLGFRNSSSNKIQSFTNADDNWRTQPPGFPTKITTFTATDSNTWASIPDGCVGIRVQLNGPGGGGGGYDPSGPNRGGGGGGGEYVEVYISESEIGSNTFVYAGLPTGASGGVGASVDGDDGNTARIRLDTTTGTTGPIVCEAEGGKGGLHGNNTGLGGLGGNGGGSINIGSGWSIPGCPGEGGYDRGVEVRLITVGRGGDSYLGSGGRPPLRFALVLATNGFRGGGGGGGYRDSALNADATDGGDAYVILTFY